MSAVAKVRVGGVWVPTSLVTRTAYAGLPIDYLLAGQIISEFVPKSGDNYATFTDSYAFQQPATKPPVVNNPAINGGQLDAPFDVETVSVSTPPVTVVDSTYSFTLV